MSSTNTHKSLIIIGGGAMGTSLLYHLAKLGWQDLLLIEKNELTAGSTWHAAGLCTHFAHSATVMQMRAYSARLYNGELSADTEMPVSFHQCGALRITRAEDRMREFRHVQGLGAFLDMPFHIIEPKDLDHLYPLALQGDGMIGGIYEPWDGYVDPTQATHAMAAGARQRGADILRHTTVIDTQQQADGSWLVTTNKGSFSCSHLVNAAGTWGYEIGRMMGVELPMVPMLHQYLVTDDIADIAALDKQLPMIRDPEESWYLRQEGNGYIFGTYEEAGIPWSVDKVPVEFGMELLPPDLDAMLPILEKAMQRIPALQQAAVKTIVNGPITFTPDAAPLIGPAFGLRNAWLLTGSSMGVMEGGGAGHLLANWIDQGTPPYDALGVDSRRYGAYANGSFRIDKAVECFGRQFGLHYPVEHLPVARNQRLSPLHDRWLDQGAIMGTAYGWERADYFSTQDSSSPFKPAFDHTNAHVEVARECAMAQDSLVFVDLSLFAKFSLSGADAEAVMHKLGANLPPTSIGGIALMHVLTQQGGVDLEFTVTRTAEDSYYLNTAAAAERIAWQTLQQLTLHDDVCLTNLSDEVCILGVFGPASVALLAQASHQDLSQGAWPWLTSQHLNLKGHQLRALRLSYIGEAGFELHVPREILLDVYTHLHSLAENANIPSCPIGMFAVNAMRLEKGYPSWGMDFTTERSPLEAGMQPFVKFENHEFKGKQALASCLGNGWQLKLCAVANNPGPCFGGQTVYDGSEAIGIVSSGAFGHRCQQNLAFVWFRQMPRPASPLHVNCLGTDYDLKTLNTPPYDAQNLRLRT